MEGGNLITDWLWVDTPDTINVLVHEKQSNLFILFKQQKYGYTGLKMATLGGYMEPGEAPQEAAQREMLEEMGLLSEQW